jgi:hypothetical protein
MFFFLLPHVIYGGVGRVCYNLWWGGACVTIYGVLGRVCYKTWLSGAYVTN